MSSHHHKSKNRSVIRSSPDIHVERPCKPGKGKHALSEEFKILSDKISNIREWTKHLIRDSVALVSVESDMDIKSYLDDSEKQHLGTTKLETLGMDMINAANCSGVKGGPYEKALLKVGECERKLGSYQRDFVVDVCSSYIRPLKYFMEVDLNKLSEEKEMLTSRKIDYDYHVRQASNGKADKNTTHKLKMAEMALEFQYVHAKEILRNIEVSECQVGHLNDLVNFQSVYHQKCLAELEKVKKELSSTSCNGSTDETNRHSLEDTELKSSIARPKRRGNKVFKPEMRPSCWQRLDNPPVRENIKIPPELRVIEELYPRRANKTQLETPFDSEKAEGEDVQLEKTAPRVSMARTDLNHSRSFMQPENQREVKCPQKAGSAMSPSAEVMRPRLLVQMPEDCRLAPNFKPPSHQECSRSHSKVCSSLKTGGPKPADVNRSCHHYCGDHAGSVRKEDYSSDDSTSTASSRETHVIPIPTRNNYRRDVGKIFFTPCKDLE